jgi:hypothetical protein
MKHYLPQLERALGLILFVSLFLPYGWGKSAFVHVLDALATQANFFPILILPNIIVFVFYIAINNFPVEKVQRLANPFFIIAIVYFILSCLLWIALFISDTPNFVYALLVVLPSAIFASWILLSKVDKLWKTNSLLIAGMLPAVTFFGILCAPSIGFFSQPGIGYYTLHVSFLGILVIRIVQLVQSRKIK